LFRGCHSNIYTSFPNKFIAIFRHLDNTELKVTDTVEMTTNGENNNYIPNLKWNKLTLLNAGVIKVHARNSEGEASCTAKLAINGK